MCRATSPHYPAFIDDTISLASTSMLQLEAPVVQREELGDERSRLTLAAPQLAARAQPGHVLAIRPAGPALDPLVRTAVALAGAAPGPGTVSLLLTPGRAEPGLHRAWQVDVLGAIGKGWTLEGWQRNLLLIGTDVEVGALLLLAGSATGRNVALLVGTAQESEPLPASLLAPSVEYQSGRGVGAAEAALDLLDDALLRWADVIFRGCLLNPRKGAFGRFSLVNGSTCVAQNVYIARTPPRSVPEWHTHIVTKRFRSHNRRRYCFRHTGGDLICGARAQVW